MVEKQPTISVRTPANARIVFNEGRTMVSCVVHALSDSGAVLHVHSVFGIPTAFRLSLSDQIQHSCWIVRKTAKEIRVAFTDWEPVSDAIGA